MWFRKKRPTEAEQLAAKLLKEASNEAKRRKLTESLAQMNAEAEAVYEAMSPWGSFAECPKCVVGELEWDWAKRSLAMFTETHDVAYPFLAPTTWHHSKEYEFLVVSCGGCGFVLGREKTADVGGI